MFLPIYLITVFIKLEIQTIGAKNISSINTGVYLYIKDYIIAIIEVEVTTFSTIYSPPFLSVF
jgi:hypothetical protein